MLRSKGFEGMRKFIVSDLHGDKEAYDSIMEFLDNISKEEDVELYINGDLIDRGKYSFEMLSDCIERINGEKGKVKVNYLAGNHELLMCQDILYRLNTNNFPSEDKSVWLNNGGKFVFNVIKDWDNDLLINLCDFMLNLDVYHKFDETINGKKLLLVHAKAPKEVLDTPLKLVDLIGFRFPTFLWSRDKNVGNESYTTMIGHLRVDNKYGFCYNKDENLFRIDGGSGTYVSIKEHEHKDKLDVYESDFDHVPLVEVKKDSLVFLTFNHSNNIISGYRYKDYKYSKIDLDDYKKYLGGEEKPTTKGKRGFF